MPARIVTLARYAVALALTLSATATLAMNPALLKRQTDAGQSKLPNRAAGHGYMRLISAEDWVTVHGEDRREIRIEIPAHTFIELQALAALPHGCDIKANATGHDEPRGARLPVNFPEQSQSWTLHLDAVPASNCDPHAITLAVTAQSRSKKE